MNKGINSFSSGSLLYNKSKPRKGSGTKRKKSRESSKEKTKSKLYNSPGKIMVGNYAPQTSSTTFLQNSSTDPTNLKYSSARPVAPESAFKNLVYSPNARPSSKKK
jgi:hypothetical protein